ncbi:MAG: PaaI family thioesterase [Deltaproteobacteria bacterium]|nr:PaaI family thioesterase [Deltaproteobacteria bacterium]
MYHQAPCNQAHAPRLAVGDEMATVVMDVAPDMHHAAGAVHGAFYFKLLDDAAYFAANSLVEDVFVLTASMHVEFLRPVVRGRLRAEGRVIKAGRTLSFAESNLFDEEGGLLARGSGTFARSRFPLADLSAPAIK